MMKTTMLIAIGMVEPVVTMNLMAGTAIVQNANAVSHLEVMTFHSVFSLMPESSAWSKQF